MSQLVVRPGRNAARQARRLKEVRKVKNAIQWHERERKKRQELMQERWESKRAALNRAMWENEQVHKTKKRALVNAKEDWKLGPLRPNRAIGPDADKYGALTVARVQKPDIPVTTLKHRNAVREKKGLELEYPLVVDDKKYFPIVKDDRVVILKGKDAGKIGVVRDVLERTHEVLITEMNLQYFDSTVFSAVNEDMGPKRESEVPIPLDDVRLVIASEINQGGKKHYKDVLVEKIFMERHTTGIDPYTGIDYGNSEIPEEHQYDPRNGLPVFDRYIAGTNHRIEWPWEREEWTEEAATTEEKTSDNRSWFKKTVATISQPFSSLDRWRSSNKASRDQQALTTDDIEENLTEIEKEQRERLKTSPPRSKDVELPEAYDDVDTTRNIVEGSDSMSYTLVAPPFPDTISEELRGDIRDFSIKANKERDPDAPRVKIHRHSEQGMLAREIAKQRKRAADAMKTPMQLRWELEQKKKAETREKQPLVDQESLLAALGQHMQKKAAKPYLGKKQIPSQDQELD